MQQERTRTVLGLFFVLALLTAFGTIFLSFRFGQSIDRERLALISLEREIGAVDVALSDLKAAQHAYFAPEGQAHDFWMRRATELIGRIETMLAGRRDATPNADARARYQAAIVAVAALADADSRAREHLANLQSALAADLIFTDTVENAQRVRTELAEAQAAEGRAATARVVDLQHLSLGVQGGAFALLIALLLLAGRRPRQEAPSPASLTAQMIRDLPPPVKTSQAPQPVRPVAAAAIPSVNLTDAAELCVDLARVLDGRDVPALVQRAAQLLDAKGVILWAPEAGGAALRPSLTHGYSAKVVSRLGTLDVTADNVTSLCFRSMRSQVMPGATQEASGAIAVPLITPNGCAGVLAAEVRETKPSPELVALTRIIAAQFAVLVAPSDLGDTQNAAQA